MSRTIREKGYSWPLFSREIGRDKKPYWKPNKRYKVLRRREERAKVKAALKKDLESFDFTYPKFRRRDVWDWL